VLRDVEAGRYFDARDRLRAAARDRTATLAPRGFDDDHMTVAHDSKAISRGTAALQMLNWRRDWSRMRAARIDPGRGGPSQR
jgi:hypothetical protein